MNYKSVIIFCFTVIVALGYGQTAYFADGYHGGIYGHYPMWQAEFMVDKLIAYPDWKINLEIEPETWDVVKTRDADHFKRFQEYYERDGRFGRIEFANPAYAQPYCYNISGESIIRHFAYGMEKIIEHFPNASFTTYSCEEPCFTSSLPQILTSFGFKYAVLRNPNTCWGGYTSAFGKDLVRWKSSDGSSILTVPRYGCEELVRESTWQTASWNNSPEFIDACIKSGVQYPVGMCFQDAGWRHGPWLENAAGSFYQPTEYVIWTDYINMIVPEVTPLDWDFTIEDVKPGLVWGAQVLQKLAQEVRYTENRLVMAEKAAVFNTICHGRPYPKKQLNEAWRNLMLSQHHDCWIVPYNSYQGKTWAENVKQWTDQANLISDRIIKDAFDNVQTRPGKEDCYIKVFNTLGAQRTDLVTVTLPDDMDPEQYHVQNMDGNIADSQIAAGHDEQKELIFSASVPAMGYSTYQLVSNKPKSNKIKTKQLAEGSLQIETNYYVAVIEASKGGGITNLIAKKLNNRQLVKDGQVLNSLCGYFYEKGEFISSEGSPARVSVIENGSLLIRLKAEGQLAGHPYTQLITFYNNEPRIDFDLSIDWQGQPGMGAYSQDKNYTNEQWKKAFYDDKYKLQVRFPLKGVGDRVFKNAPFDVCQSQLDNTYYDSWDTIKHNVILNWVDAADDAGKLGVTLFSDHTTSYINSDAMPLGLTVQYVGRALWGRNYRLAGPTHIKYALLPHDGKWDDFGVHAQSAAWNEPLLASVSKTKPAQSQRSLLDIETDGFELTSMFMNSDDLFVRIFNAESTSETAVVNIHHDFDKIQLVQLNRELIRDISVVKVDKKNQIKVSVPRFGVRTICLSKSKMNQFVMRSN